MIKTFLASIFGILLMVSFYIFYSTFELFPVNDSQIEKSHNQQLKYPTSDKVEFKVISKSEYSFGEPINITLRWKNNSEKDERIMIREYWNHPIGVGAEIKKIESDENLERYRSRHFLSSKLFSPEELTDYEIVLKTNEVWEIEVDLSKIPSFKDSELDRSTNIPRGEYLSEVSYYDQKSNEFRFEIE